MKLKCKNCKNEFELPKVTMTLSDGEFVIKETCPKCKGTVEDITEFKGFPTNFKAKGDIMPKHR